jgi:hypothetical protein
LYVVPVLLAALGGCATSQQAKLVDTAGSAVTSPLQDLNMVRAPIPPLLAEAHKAPYQRPADTACAALAAQVKALDEVLGPDLDTPPTANDPGLIERGSQVATDSAAGAIKSAAENVVPFRGWIRKLSGAERYARDVAAAIAAGTVRRAYLKGLAQGQGCAAESR